MRVTGRGQRGGGRGKKKADEASSVMRPVWGTERFGDQTEAGTCERSQVDIHSAL